MITWTIPEQSAQYILNMLDRGPHGEVRALIDELMRQTKPKPKVVEGEQIPGLKPKLAEVPKTETGAA
jgi:hypothetical protein